MDDTNIFITIITSYNVSYQCYIKLQQYIVAFEGWPKLWKLNFICTKTLVMRLVKIIQVIFITWVVFSSKQSRHKVTHVILPAKPAKCFICIIRKTFIHLNSHTLPLIVAWQFGMAVPWICECDLGPYISPTYLTDNQNIESVLRKRTKLIPETSSLLYSTQLQHLYNRSMHQADMIVAYTIS